MLDIQKARSLYGEAVDRIKTLHIGTFAGMEKPLFLISNTYPGVWLEHVYDSVFWATLEPEYLYVAQNTINLFIDRQTDAGQFPCYIWDANRTNVPPELLTGYCQTQECVSFARLCLEVCRKSGDPGLTRKCFEAAKKWESWLCQNRMTTGRGLVELFFGYDTGHDNSGRLDGMSCKGNLSVGGELMNAAHLPPDDGITPIIAVDMNANFYSTELAIAEFADLLGLPDEASARRAKAADVKRRLFELCYDKDDAFFYDVDRAGNKRRYLSSTIFHLFLEGVLDPESDAALIGAMYDRHIKNPDEFWTNYPFPSMAVSDPSCEGHAKSNCWGYFSQGLIALRCTRWMDRYGFSADFDSLCEKWLEAWTEHCDMLRFGQELDPFTGIPSPSSEWYSSCMLFYIYSARRLGIVK